MAGEVYEVCKAVLGCYVAARTAGGIPPQSRLGAIMMVKTPRTIEREREFNVHWSGLRYRHWTPVMVMLEVLAQCGRLARAAWECQ